VEKKELLGLRKKVKAKKPNFIRQDAHKKAEISKKWRRPKGIQSKMRLKKKGYRRSPSKGYRSPALIRGLHASGLVLVRIASKKELENVDPKIEGVVINAAVGFKKRTELVKYAKEKGITILNIKNIDEYLKKIDEKLKNKKEEKEKKKEKKEKKEKEKKAAKPKKEEKLAEKLTEEEQKDQEKKEKDKLLTKKEG
jgi:large subunit ribosomal protein L32e